MNFSTTVNSILPAFNKAQIAAKNPTKNKESHNHKYADLDEVMNCIRGPMRENGLMLIQSTGFEEGQFGLFTRLVHVESGEYVESFYVLDSDLNPQDQGKENTYFRRYSIQNLFSLVAQDDNDADGIEKKPRVKNVTSFAKGGL